MASMIQKAKFDIIWVQFYNTPSCSARSWVTSGSGFSYDAWAKFLVGTKSAAAKLYIGLPGSTAAANSAHYLQPAEAARLLKNFYCHANFGGVMLWDATYAANNLNGGIPYYATIKKLLLAESKDTSKACNKGSVSTTKKVVVVTKTSTVKKTTSKTSKSSTIKKTTTKASKTSTIKKTTTKASKTSTLKKTTVTTTRTVTMTIQATKTVTRQVSLVSASNTSTTSTPTVSSNDGACGNGKMCQSDVADSCCSQFGFCGSGDQVSKTPMCTRLVLDNTDVLDSTAELAASQLLEPAQANLFENLP
jgi:chitinase